MTRECFDTKGEVITIETLTENERSGLLIAGHRDTARKALCIIDALTGAHAYLSADRDDFERRWLAECRAHGDTRRKLAAAHHELGDHSLCDATCEGDQDHSLCNHTCEGDQ